jgi:hypothetical protein
MESTHAQIQSFDLDKQDPISLEDTLAYPRQHPEPLAPKGGFTLPPIQQTS